MHAWPALAFLAILSSILVACADLEPGALPGLSPEPPPTPTMAAPQPTASSTLSPADQRSAATTATAGEPVSQLDSLYRRGGEIWSYDATAGQKRAVLRGLAGLSPMEEGDPWALAPDGQRLAMARNAEGPSASLTLFDLGDGHTEQLGSFEGRIEALRWSHDAGRLAILVKQRDELTGELRAQSLRLYDRTSGGQAVVYQRRFAGEETSRLGLWLEGWVPGDAALYLVMALEGTGDPGTLHALNVRGGEPRLVSEEFLLKGGQPICALTSEVLLRRRVTEIGPGSRSSPLHVARAGLGGMLTGIRPLGPEDWFVGAVAWSPDGQQVAAERLEAGPHGTFAVHLWLLALDNSAPRQLTGDEVYREERPVWLSGGRGILFDRWQALRPEHAGLWLAAPGSEPILVDEAGTRPQAPGALLPGG